MITAKVVLDSLSSNGGDNARLITMLCKYPKFIHGEHLRHRSMSFSVSSSRAIPVSKNLEEVRRESRASPIWWGAEQKGMSATAELDGQQLDLVKQEWQKAARYAIQQATLMQLRGAHKSIVNRILEPFLHVNVLVSGTTPGWMNFFGLRLDRAAQPEIRALAEECWRVWNDSRPRKLFPGDWHLPFVDAEYWEGIVTRLEAEFDSTYKTVKQELPLKVSAACCAHLSFESFETGKRMSIEQCLKVHDQLFPGPGKPIHASPFEHQATLDTYIERYTGKIEHGCWTNPNQGGNFGPGWIQYRKTLPNEAVAPLPEGY